MPIGKQFHYADEAEFTSQFLVPLLRRLGYSVVVHYHGAQELGKDLIFGEIDRFGQVAYHGLQAKYVGSISQSDSQGLIDDCREAFNNPFRHPSTGAEERISTFTIANGGSIAPNARTNFFNALATPHGGHIRMLDGKALVDLDRWASMRQAESVGPQLTGLFLEFQYNMRLLASMKNTLKDIADHGHSPVGSERLRLVAAEVYLAHPVLVDRLDVDKIVSYWHDAANVLNAELDRLRLCRGEPRWTLAADLLEVSERICTTSSLLKDVLQTILTELGPIAGM